jgi:hypothetical protein
MQAVAVGCVVTLVGCASRQFGQAPSQSSKAPAVTYYRAEIIAVPDWGERDRGPWDPTIAPYDPLTAAGSGDQIKARFRGVVGPPGMRPNTAWEVHPITKLELGPA